MKNFWLMFAIQEAVAVTSAVVASSPSLSPAQKTALENLVSAGQQVAAAFGV